MGRVFEILLRLRLFKKQLPRQPELNGDWGDTIVRPERHDASRLEALESGWMDVPRDCYAQRTVTWGKFQIRATGDEFWFFNTHLPHNGCAATDRNTHAGIARQLVDSCVEIQFRAPHAIDEAT